MTNREIIATESQEQSSLFQWARLMERQRPVLRLLYHIPNGGLRNKAVAVRLAAEGVKRGVPDICLPVARKCYHGLYIELKRRKGGVISPEQSEWIAALNAQGFKAVVCRGWDEARITIENYLEE